MTSKNVAACRAAKGIGSPERLRGVSSSLFAQYYHIFDNDRSRNMFLLENQRLDNTRSKKRDKRTCTLANLQAATDERQAHRATLRKKMEGNFSSCLTNRRVDVRKIREYDWAMIGGSDCSATAQPRLCDSQKG